jgi:F-type H+-transporting ATPase subunit epsilon
MKLRLMTPEATLFDGEAASVRGRSPLGEFEILPSHATWVSPTEPCCVKVNVGADGAGEELTFAVHGGLIEVHPDSVLILADAAEAGESIDEARATGARARAEERLRLWKLARRGGSGGRGEGREVDVERARRALARALARVDAGSA